MPNIVKHTELKRITGGLWDSIKNLFVSDVKVENGEVKKVMGDGTETVLSPLVTHWGDLESVQETDTVNIVDFSKVQLRKALDNGQGNTLTSNIGADWGIIEMPLTTTGDYTILKKVNGHNFKISVRNAQDTVLQYINEDTNNLSPVEGWYRHKFTITDSTVAKIVIEVKVNHPNESEMMILKGDQLTNPYPEHIYYANLKNIHIKSDVSLGFNAGDSGIKALTVEDAIKEVNKNTGNQGANLEALRNELTQQISTKADQTALTDAEQRLQANIDLKADKTALDALQQEVDTLEADLATKVSTINSVSATSGNIDLALAVNGDNLDFSVGGTAKSQVPLMTTAQADEIIASFTL